MPVIIGNTSEETNPWADTADKVIDDASYAAAIEKVFGVLARDRTPREISGKFLSNPSGRVCAGDNRRRIHLPETGAWRELWPRCRRNRFTGISSPIPSIMIRR